MKTLEKQQRGFLVLFAFVVVLDTISAIAKMSEDELLSNLASLWRGPFDDIFYLIVGLQAAIFLLDPGGGFTRLESSGYSLSKIWQYLGSGDQVLRGFASRFTSGTSNVLYFLTSLLGAVWLLGCVNMSAVSKGLYLMSVENLAMVFPVSVTLAVGFWFLKLVRVDRKFWPAVVLSTFTLILVALGDGRWSNHFYHLFANLEDMRAWCATMAWTATAVALQKKFAS